MALSILMFCPQFRPLVGGAERQAEKLSIALAAQGCHVKILTPQLDPSSALVELVDGVDVERFPLFNLKEQFPKLRGTGPLNLLILKTQIKKIIKKHAHRFDVIHTHIACPLTAFAMEAAIEFGKPVICKVAMTGAENDLDRVRAIGFGGGSIANRLKKEMTRWVATTAAVEEGLLAQGVAVERISRIPNGVDVKAPNAHQASEAARFLYLGRLSTDAQRDVPTLIQAFDRLAEQYSNIELAIVGNGNLFEATKIMAHDAKHSARIKMPGEQPPDAWLSWANCYVQPSRREGLSNALLEAMSSELACIANDIPPNREVLDHGAAGWLTKIGDVDDLYKKMHALASDEEQRRYWGQLARTRAANIYSIDSIAKKYIRLYKELLNESSQQI